MPGFQEIPLSTHFCTVWIFRPAQAIGGNRRGPQDQGAGWCLIPFLFYIGIQEAALPRQFSRHRNRDSLRQNRQFEKSRKKSKKGVDNRGDGWYYSQAVARDTADCKAENRTFREPLLIAGGSEPAQRPAETDVESDRKTSKKFLTKELRRGKIDKLSQRQQASRNG